MKNLLNKYLEEVQSEIQLGNLEKPIDYYYCFNFEYIEKSEKLKKGQDEAYNKMKHFLRYIPSL